MRLFAALLALGPFAFAQKPSDAAAAAAGPVIQTYAGADFTFQSEGKPAPNVPFGLPQDVAVDPAGNLYIADQYYQAYRVSPSGLVAIFAGNGFRRCCSNGVAARDASLLAVRSVATGPDGVYLGITGIIQKVSATGILTTVAGNGAFLGLNAPLGDNGPALKANIGDFPLGIVFDNAGNLYFSDFRYNRVRKIDKNGIVTTIAGGGPGPSSGDGGPGTSAVLSGPHGLRFDRAGNLLIADGGSIRKLAPDGTITTFASGFNGAHGIDFDAKGNLLVAEEGASRVRMVSSDGRVITTVAGTGVAGFGGDGGLATKAQLNSPRGLCVDSAGNILVADTVNQRIRAIAPSGNISTIAGNGQYRISPDGTPATLAYFQDTWTTAVSKDGLVYVSDRTAGSVYRIEANGTRTRVAGTGVPGISGNGSSPARSTPLSYPQGMAFDSKNNLYIADSLVVRRVTPDGTMTTFAGGGNSNPGDSGPATAATLRPTYVFVDKSDNVYISESVAGNSSPHRVRKVTPAGILSTVAGTGVAGFQEGPTTTAQFQGCAGLAMDAAGNLYVADLNNGRIRKISRDGTVSTYAGGGSNDPAAGGPATAASLPGPFGIAFDSSGALLIVASGADRVFRVTPDGNISLLAGKGDQNFAGDGGPAAQASFYFPNDIALDAAGNAYITDTLNFRVRVIPAAAPTITATPQSLSFTASAGSASTAPQQIAVMGSISGVPFTVTTTPAFLTANVIAGGTPATLSVTVNPGALVPGNYSGTITITPAIASSAPVTISVALTVTAALPPQLSVDTGGLSFAFVRGGSAATRRILLTNAGSGSQGFTAAAKTASGGNWLSVTPAQGSVTSGAPVSLNVTADPTGLAPNTYTGTVTITDPQGGKVTVAVTMTVSNSGQLIRLSQRGLTFLGVQGAGATSPQNIFVLNGGQGSLAFTAKTIVPPGTPGWLTISPTSGTAATGAPAMITASVSTAGLPPGDYYARLQVASAGVDNSPQEATIVFSVAAKGTDPGPVVQPAGLVFTGVAGAGDPASQNVTVSNLTADAISFTSAAATLDGGTYLLYQPTSYSLTGGSINLVVQPSFSGLSAGIYRGTITLVFSTGSVRTIAILMVIAPAGTTFGSPREVTGCAPKQLLPLITSLGTNFTVPAALPAAVTVKVVDDCGAPHVNGATGVAFSNGDSPASLTSLGDGNWTGSWQSVNTAQTAVTLTAGAENPALAIRGSIQVTGAIGGTANAPVVSQGGVISGSSFAVQSPLAPGAIVSIYGSRLSSGTAQAVKLPLDTQLAGTQVVIAGRNAPLLYSSDGQVNAILPLGTPLNVPVSMTLLRGNQFSVPIELSIAAASPGIFTTTGTGSGQGHVYVNQPNGALILADTRTPARAGDVLTMYCSGLGALDSNVADGAMSPLDRLVNTANAVTVNIGGQSVPAVFAGLAPGFAVGLYQVNVTMPAGAGSGDQVPVFVTVAGQSSRTVTISAR